LSSTSTIASAERAIAHADRAQTSDHAPVFVLAPIRSCSTICVAVLAGHPDLFGFPEMLLFTAPTVRGLLAEQERRPKIPAPWIRARLTGVLRAVAQLHEGSQAPEAIERAERWLAERSDWPTASLMDHLLNLAGPRTGIENSPDTAVTDEALQACLAAYPNARFIHLTRHPVTSQRSMHEHVGQGWRRSRQELTARCATVWLRTHVRIAKALTPLPPERWLRVRAEDLLRDPATTLPRICSWLGLRCDAEIISRMRRTEEWCFADTGPADNLYGGDLKFLRSPVLQPTPDPGPVVFDPSWELRPDVVDRMTRLAGYLGY
jgi:hypothetical protein